MMYKISIPQAIGFAMEIVFTSRVTSWATWLASGGKETLGSQCEAILTTLDVYLELLVSSNRYAIVEVTGEDTLTVSYPHHDRTDGQDHLLFADPADLPAGLEEVKKALAKFDPVTRAEMLAQIREEVGLEV